MAAHTRTVRHGWRDRDVACPVRGVDAAHAIGAWLDRRVSDVARDEATAQRQRREAEAQLRDTAAALARLAALRDALDALRALVDVALPSPAEAAPAAAGRGR